MTPPYSYGYNFPDIAQDFNAADAQPAIYIWQYPDFDIEPDVLRNALSWGFSNNEEDEEPQKKEKNYEK